MFSPLGIPLTQALPATIQQKPGLPESPNQNTPGATPEIPYPMPPDASSIPGFNPAMANPGVDASQAPANGARVPLKEKMSQLLHLKKRTEAMLNPDGMAQNPLLPSGTVDGGKPDHGLITRLKHLWPRKQPQQPTQDGMPVNPDGMPSPDSVQAKGVAQSVASKLGPLTERLSRLFKRKPHPNQPEPGQPMPPEGSLPENAPPNNVPGGKQGTQTPPGEAPPLQRLTAPPNWKPEMGIVTEGPWAKKIEPLTVDQIFERKSKGWVVRAPKYSLKPDDIRVNYIRKQQECLEKMIFALPWKDDDVINPFHTGPCNVTD